MSQILTRDSSKNSFVPSFGFVMISTAPFASAASATSEPAPVRVEQMTTGIGCWLMSLSRNVKPSIRGISMSSVMTSGGCALIRSTATYGSAATAMTSICGSVSRSSFNDCLTKAESSTMRTRMCLFGVIFLYRFPEYRGMHASQRNIETRQRL